MKISDLSPNLPGNDLASSDAGVQPLLLTCYFDPSINEEPKLESSDYEPVMVEPFPDLVGAAFQNINYTCYLNSILQCTIHTVPLLEKLRSSEHHHHDPGNDSDLCFCCALKKLIDLCMEKSGWIVTPVDFINHLSEISPDFLLGRQEDAHEFFICLLDKLHDSCLDPSSKDSQPSMDSDSIVKQVFGGHSTSQLQCCKCGECSSTPEPFSNICLEISDADTLMDALESYTKWEKIDDQKLTCDGCKSQVFKEKQTKIDHAPTVLSLSLKRFRNNGQFIHKICKFVEYPLELDLRPFMSCPNDEEQTKYDLYGVVVHYGNYYSGHYCSLIRSSPATWHKMDDIRVNEVSETSALTEKAYILFYIKQGSSPWFSSLMEEATGSFPLYEEIPDLKDASLNIVLSLSTAEETSGSNCKETFEREPGPCPDVSFESAAENSPCTSPDAVKGQFQSKNSKTTNTDQFSSAPIDKFADDFLDKLASNGEKENCLACAFPTSQPQNSLLGNIPGPGRPATEKFVRKSHPIVLKPRSLNNKKRRTV